MVLGRPGVGAGWGKGNAFLPGPRRRVLAAALEGVGAENTSRVHSPLGS